MAKRKPRKRDIENYAHTDKERVNNPPVGLVTPETDKDAARKTYAHDPHIDPQLSWAGKAEHTAFEVPTVSLHVHERIDPRTVIEAVRKRNGASAQASLFEEPEENPPIRQTIELYQHRHNWSNRLIAGDSLLVTSGFDYYNTKTGDIESGGANRIAIWMLDTDYDGRSLYPRQVFFPMAARTDGWAKIARNLKAEIDEQRIEATAAPSPCRSRLANMAALR